jgi:hypothetical protein
MSGQIKLHTKQLLGIPLVYTINQFEDELNILLTEGWTIGGNLIQVTNTDGQMVILQPLFRVDTNV